MRTSKDPNHKIDWDTFNTDRHNLEAGKKEGVNKVTLGFIISQCAITEQIRSKKHLGS